MDPVNIVRPVDNVPIIQTWGSTQGEHIKCKYTWTITHFSSCKRFYKTGSINSPTFPEEAYGGLQWKLLVYPNGFEIEDNNYISVMVEFVSNVRCVSDCTGNITLKILNFPSEVISIREYFKLEEKFIIGIRQFIQQDVLVAAITNDTLIISCEIYTSHDYVLSYTDTIFSKGHLGNDLKSLFENHDFSDVTLSIGRWKLKAHKAILAARSPVFKAMFHHDMTEKVNNNVKITDITYEALTEMLRFIYTGKVQNFKIVGLDLIVAADKYQIEGLKAICENLSKTINISIENAAKTFTFSVLYRVVSLKTAALNFIQRYPKDVIATPGWKEMIAEYPYIVEEAFCGISQSYSTAKQTAKRRKLN